MMSKQIKGSECEAIGEGMIIKSRSWRGEVIFCSGLKEFRMPRGVVPRMRGESSRYRVLGKVEPRIWDLNVEIFLGGPINGDESKGIMEMAHE